jgi:uncharacterized glyoxalase superfamily protein PhnB
MTTVLNMIGLIAQDMPKTLAFYRQLGMDIPAEMDEEDHVEVVLEGGLRFAWDSEAMIRGIDPNWQPPQGGHRVAFAFLCDSSAEVDSVYQAMIDAGHASHKAPFDAFWGQRYAQIIDPDGNIVDLFAYLPQEKS